MATQFQQQAEAQLNPLFNQQQQAIQSQLPSIENLYNTLTTGLQSQYQQNLSSGVQGIVEDASARGVLRSTLPVDARQSLTAQLGAALQQSLGELGARRAGDIAGVNQSLAQLGLQRASSIADLSRALETQDLERQQFELQKQQAEREYQLAQQKLALERSTASRSASQNSYFTRPTASGGVTFYSPQGTPITAAQFYSAQGGNIADVRNFLQQYHPNGQALKDLKSGMSQKQLASKYPHVFGGV